MRDAASRAQAASAARSEPDARPMPMSAEPAERMTARISEIEIQYVRLPMTEIVQDG